MKLKTIKRTKTTSIVLANDEYWGILPDKILHFYCKGQLEYFELSDQEAEKFLEEIKKQSWNKLLNYLAYRERSYGECSEFLSKKIFLRKELQSVLLEKAVSLNFINDSRFAEMLTEDLIRNFKSKIEIKNKLYAKKINENIISNVIQKKFNSKTENEILEKNIMKAKSRFSNLKKYKRDEKILNYLTRKGFTYWEVKEKLGE
ncbi:MAG: RecX family transcriptional regulator [Candidatus Tenebribacter burtonii]|jgi:SOS response regulatory protein OraA/RecX|nr:RecX family transcriptional regulator [Candidatus Tenebribacter burtonii]